MKTNVMFDIETLGSTLQAPVISIAAVVFSPSEGTVDVEGAFYKNIRLDDALLYGSVEAGTLKWWQGEDKHSVFKSIIFDKEAVTTETALSSLNEWVTERKSGELVPWSKGIDFDFPLLIRLYEATGIKHPFFRFWAKRDLRTFIDTCKYGGVKSVTVEREEGLAHDALSDVVYQCRELIAYGDELRRVYSE